MSHTPSPPTPAAWLDENLVRRAAQASRQGLSYRAALEQLLLELDDVSAGRLLMLLREGRAAWLPMISTQRGEALLIGDPLSGAAVPLARLGLKLTILDPGGARSELAAWRDRELGLGSARFVPLEGPARLPFADDSFDLVIRESEAPPLGLPLALELAELERVGRGELAWIVENRLAYKRSSGERASFAVARPLESSPVPCSAAGAESARRLGTARPCAPPSKPRARLPCTPTATTTATWSASTGRPSSRSARVKRPTASSSPV